MNWIEQVTILDLLVKGLIVGVVVSAPLGPVGVLCIQRTLNKGRWYGFVTGLGAALSDIGYALITGYGMSLWMISWQRTKYCYKLSAVSCCSFRYLYFS